MKMSDGLNSISLLSLYRHCRDESVCNLSCEKCSCILGRMTERCWFIPSALDCGAMLLLMTQKEAF